MPFSPARRIAFLYSPLARPSVFYAACQSADSSRFSFGNTVLQPARPAGPPISVIHLIFFFCVPNIAGKTPVAGSLR